MEPKNKTPNPVGSSHLDLTELIEQLLDEQFAIAHGFGELTFEQVGRVIEDARSALESVPETAPERVSFDKCVEVYCTLLLAMEEKGAMPEDTLGELTHREQRTQLVQIRTQESPIPEPPGPTRTASKVPSMDEVKLRQREINDLWSSLTAGDVPEVPANVEMPPIPQEALFENPLSQDLYPQPKAEPTAVEIEEEDTGGFTDLEVKIPEPPMPAPTRAILSSRRAPAAPKPAVTVPEPAAPMMPARSARSARPVEDSSVPLTLSSQRAQEYWQLASHFKNQRDSGQWPFPQTHIARLIGQCLCFSVEAECVERLSLVIGPFWSSREAAVRSILDTGARKFDLHTDVKAAIDHLASEHTEWLLEGKFPHSAVLTSLRYIMATLSADKFQPSLLEAGILLYFFGQETNFEHAALRNHLGVGGLEPREQTELLFRLSRLHRFRGRILTAAGEFEHAHLLILEQDAGAVISLLERLELGAATTKRAA